MLALYLLSFRRKIRRFSVDSKYSKYSADHGPLLRFRTWSVSVQFSFQLVWAAYDAQRKDLDCNTGPYMVTCVRNHTLQ